MISTLMISTLMLSTPPPSPPPYPPPRFEVDRSELGRDLAKWLFGQPVSVNELLIVDFHGRHHGREDGALEGAPEGAPAGAPEGAPEGGRRTKLTPRQCERKLVVRVVDVDAEADDEVDDGGGLDAEEGGEREVASVTAAGVHCFRGLVGSATRVFVGHSTAFKGSASQRAVSDGLILLPLGWSRPAPRRRSNVLTLITSDGESFPVNRLLLRPCLSLTKVLFILSLTPIFPICHTPFSLYITSIHFTKAVRSEASHEASVEVDCATFDRVLLYLEARAAGRASHFSFDMATLESLRAAAKALRLASLEEACDAKRGAFESRVCMHTWAEVKTSVFLSLPKCRTPTFAICRKFNSKKIGAQTQCRGWLLADDGRDAF